MHIIIYAANLNWSSHSAQSLSHAQPKVSKHSHRPGPSPGYLALGTSAGTEICPMWHAQRRLWWHLGASLLPRLGSKRKGGLTQASGMSQKQHECSYGLDQGTRRGFVQCFSCHITVFHNAVNVVGLHQVDEIIIF